MLLIALGPRSAGVPPTRSVSGPGALSPSLRDGRGGQKGNDFQVGPIFTAVGTPLLSTEQSHEDFTLNIFLGGLSFP